MRTSRDFTSQKLGNEPDRISSYHLTERLQKSVATDQGDHLPAARRTPGALDLLNYLAQPEVCGDIREALPLLLTIVNGCLQRQTTSCDLVLADLAQRLQVSPSSVLNWHRRLKDTGLIRSIRRRGYITFELAEPLAGWTAACAEPAAAAVVPSAGVNAETAGVDFGTSLMLRLERLEWLLVRSLHAGKEVA